MVIGVTMVKDEADVILHTIRHMLEQVDQVWVRDNNSSDGTYEKLVALMSDPETAGRMAISSDPELGYYQAEKMTSLAVDAGHAGADWVVPFDADELWYSPFGRIADVLAGVPGACVATAQLYDHVATGRDPAVGNVRERMGWRREEPAGLCKVACRPFPAVNVHQGNHGADYGATVDGLLVVRHYPYRSVEQFVKKVRNGAAAYAATDLPETTGQHWRDYGRILDAEGPEGLGTVFRSWFWAADPENDPTLIYDPCPTLKSLSPG